MINKHLDTQRPAGVVIEARRNCAERSDYGALVKSSRISAAGADWVSRPTLIYVTPVSAISRMVSSRPPPDASVGTRPPTSVIAPRNKAGAKIGRVSCRKRECTYVEISLVAVSLQQKQTNNKKSQ